MSFLVGAVALKIYVGVAIGAVIGGAVAALTGGDVMKGALIGGVLGGVAGAAGAGVFTGSGAGGGGSGGAAANVMQGTVSTAGGSTANMTTLTGVEMVGAGSGVTGGAGGGGGLFAGMTAADKMMLGSTAMQGAGAVISGAGAADEEKIAEDQINAGKEASKLAHERNLAAGVITVDKDMRSEVVPNLPQTVKQWQGMWSINKNMPWRNPIPRLGVESPILEPITASLEKPVTALDGSEYFGKPLTAGAK